MRPNEKCFVINLDRRLHTSIKIHAAQQNMTMTAWLLKAIALLMQEEGTNKITK